MNTNEPRYPSEDLIQKYDISGPRYTSYPTAPNFHSEFNFSEYSIDANSRKTHSDSPLSIYVHIPFCSNICYYCACNKIITKDKSVAREYLDYLSREIFMQSKIWGDKRPVQQLHFGGGTPTYFSDAEFSELMHTLARNFKLGAENAEYSIEIDPRTVDAHRLSLFKGLGINRLSMGIQDFNPQVQKSINRIQSYESVDILMQAARRLDFDSISFDLIYGLPYQTPDSLAATIDQVSELSPDRIAFYNYAHLPERFPSQRAIDRLTLPSAKQKIAMLALISTKLAELGYVHIGMDHYVKATDTLAKAQQQGHLTRNFQGYSNCEARNLVGLGVSSISSSDEYFSQNEKKLENYYARLDRAELPCERGLKINKDDQIRREAIQLISCQLEINIPEFEKAFDIDFYQYFRSEIPELLSLEADDLVHLTKTTLHVTETGRYFLRNICMCFDSYLHGGQVVQFSKAL